MRNFLHIAHSLDTVPVLNALALNPDLWNENDLRTTHPQSPHTQVDDIWMMFNRVGENAADTIDDVVVEPYRAWGLIHPLRHMVLDLMRRVEGVSLGRVIVSRMAPGTKIEPHIDQGTPATYYRRYQIALQSLPGATFRCGGEEVNFRTGDVWWFDNRQTHEVINNSTDDRIACIVDVRIP